MDFSPVSKLIESKIPSEAVLGCSWEPGKPLDRQRMPVFQLIVAEFSGVDHALHVLSSGHASNENGVEYWDEIRPTFSGARCSLESFDLEEAQSGAAPTRQLLHRQLFSVVNWPGRWVGVLFIARWWSAGIFRLNGPPQDFVQVNSVQDRPRTEPQSSENWARGSFGSGSSDVALPEWRAYPTDDVSFHRCPLSGAGPVVWWCILFLVRFRITERTVPGGRSCLTKDRDEQKRSKQRIVVNLLGVIEIKRL